MIFKLTTTHAHTHTISVLFCNKVNDNGDSACMLLVKKLKDNHLVSDAIVTLYQ